LITSLGGSYVTGAEYTAEGRLDLLELGNGLQADYEYYPWETPNGQGRLQALRIGTAANPGLLQTWGYTYDAVGNVQSLTDNGVETTFTYDALDRLTGASGGFSASYSYNQIGNLLTKTEGTATVTMEYSDPSHVHAPRKVNGQEWAYDANGNVLSRVERGVTFTQEWDAENRLEQVTNQGSGEVTTFTYDADGERVRKTVNGVSTYYIGDHYEVSCQAADVNCDGSVTVADIQAAVGRWPHPAHVVDIQYLAGRWGESTGGTQVTKHYFLGERFIATRRGDGVYYLHGDHLGSVSVVTDENGQVVLRVWRYPYGAVRGGTEYALPGEHSFTGQRVDLSTGLHHFRARYYDAYVGRFVQPDTLVPNPGDPQQLNRYTYAANNPLRYRDPSGHWFETAWDIANILWDIYEVRRDPSLVNIGALVVDVGAAVLPVVPAGAGMVVRGGKAAKVATEVATHWDEAVDVVRIAGRLDEAVDAVSAARRLREVGLHADEAGDLIKAIAKQSTHGAGDKVVLGPWKFKGIEGYYVEMAKERGAIYFATSREVWQALGKDPELAWAINEQFLRNQLEAGVKEIEIVGMTIKEILELEPSRALRREIEFLMGVGEEYGYVLVGNRWIKNP
jgi:RHS repeat-associated protein